MPPKATADLTLDEFAALFNGREENNLSGKGYTDAKSWLMTPAKDTLKKALACVIFSEKPATFLITGKSGNADRGKEVKNDNKGKLAVALKDYLPVLTQAPTDPKSVAKRAEWAEFSLINISMIRRVAFMAILDDMLPAENHIVKNWIARWGKPTREPDMNKPGWSKGDDATRAIRQTQVRAFLIERDIAENA
jgi:hypothetical protein